MLKFYSADSGSIAFAGQSVKDCDPQDLRSQVGLVSQDVFLFHGSVYENIAYGKPNATRDDVIAAAKKAHACEFIERLPQGLDTIIGERGQKLSGG